MNIIVRFKRLLRMHKGRFEVWDTSALSNWLDKLKREIERKERITVIIPEGVIHELSVGRRNYERARLAYEYIKNSDTERLRVDVTDDNKRAWTVDEQVVAVVEKYANKGYNVTLVTCDIDQAYKAKLKKLNVNLLKSYKEFDAKNPTENSKQNKTNSIKLGKPIIEIPQPTDEISIPLIQIGKEKYISVKHRIEAYDNKGKRKIGKFEKIPILPTDSFKCQNYTYRIQAITNEKLILKRVDTT